MPILEYNFTIKRGNTGTVENPAGLVIRLQDDADTPRDLTNMEFVFFAHWSGQTQIRRSSADNHITVEPLIGRITIGFGLDEFATARAGQSIRYELEQRDGGQQRTVLQGKINLEAGINDD